MENSLASVKVDTRNYGIDLLRIVSMVMIIILHIFGYTGLFSSTDETISDMIGYYIYIAAFCSVNCFGIISGYVGYNSKHKFSNIIYLTLQVIFILVISAIIYKIRYPKEVDSKLFVNSFFPIVYSQVWYFRAYFCMFFFIPFMNILMEKLNRNQARLLVGSILILFSVIPTIFSSDPYQTSYGYSAIWLISLYLIGTYLKKYDISFKSWKLLIIFLYLCLFSFVWDLMDLKTDYCKTFVSYTSPTILICAICLVLIFSNLKIGNIIKQITKFFAPLAFGVYIIHLSPYVWNKVINGLFIDCGANDKLMAIAILIGSSLLLFVVFALLDYIRLLLFKLCKIKDFCNFIEKKLRELCSKLFKEKDDKENTSELDNNNIVN